VKTLPLAVLFIGLFSLSPAQNPYDGYMFWMPNGVLEPGRTDTWAPFDYKRTPAGEKFTVRPRKTRFDAPRQQLVMAQSGEWLVDDVRKPKTPPRILVNGRPIGPVGQVVFLPTDWSATPKPVTVEIKIPRNVERTPGFAFRFFANDDADKLGVELVGDIGRLSPSDKFLLYKQGLTLLFSGQTAAAAESFRKAASNLRNPEASRLCRRLARWAEAEGAFKRIRSGSSFYKLGQYAMVIGAYDLAVRSFKKATELMPKNPHAWHM